MDTDARKVFQKNFIQIMKVRRKTQSDISRALNIPLSTVSSWYNGASYPRVDKMQALADYFGISMKDLTDDGSGIYPSAGVDFIRVPLYTPLCCGSGLFVDDQIEQMVAVPSDGLHKSPDEYFAQTAAGDSMLDAGIYPGDLLVFEKNPDLVDGMIGCFCVDDNEAVCKKFKRSHDGLIILQPANSKYDPIVITPDSHFVCVGRLRKSIRSFDWD